MEPNTQPNVETNVTPVTPNKNKKMLIVVIVIIVVLIITTFLFKSKVQAPTNINETSSTISPTEQLSKDIDTATAFDNEADLKAIDTEFQ